MPTGDVANADGRGGVQGVAVLQVQLVGEHILPGSLVVGVQKGVHLVGAVGQRQVPVGVCVLLQAGKESTSAL